MGDVKSQQINESTSPEGCEKEKKIKMKKTNMDFGVCTHITSTNIVFGLCFPFIIIFFAYNPFKKVNERRIKIVF